MKAYFFLSDKRYTEFEEKEQLYMINLTFICFSQLNRRRQLTSHSKQCLLLLPTGKSE